MSTTKLIEQLEYMLAVFDEAPVEFAEAYDGKANIAEYREERIWPMEVLKIHPMAKLNVLGYLAYMYSDKVSVNTSWKELINAALPDASLEVLMFITNKEWPDDTLEKAANRIRYYLEHGDITPEFRAWFDGEEEKLCSTV